MTGQALIVQGDALHLPLPDASVDLVCTSPPFWALRAYGAGPGEIGSEPTPTLFLEALWAATAEMMRVLKPTGSIFVDLGDKYATAFGPNSTAGKTLMLLPERYRIGCVDRLGLIARAVIVWDKPNGLPESVQDRVRRSHEDWVHLVKQPRYYSALDEVREPQKEFRQGRNSPMHRVVDDFGLADKNVNRWNPAENAYNPLGKLPGSVWTIPSEPLRLPEHLGVQHYAAFPSEWPRRLILGFSPPGICLDCGQGRVPVVERERQQTRKGDDAIRGPNDGSVIPQSDGNGFGQRAETTATILGYACSCTPFTDHLDGWKPPPTRPAVILDCFGGTGTTAMVAKALGRIGVSVDLSHAYGRAARWRVKHDGAKAISRTNLERQQVLL